MTPVLYSIIHYSYVWRPSTTLSLDAWLLLMWRSWCSAMPMHLNSPPVHIELLYQSGRPWETHSSGWMLLMAMGWVEQYVEYVANTFTKITAMLQRRPLRFAPLYIIIIYYPHTLLKKVQTSSVDWLIEYYCLPLVDSVYDESILIIPRILWNSAWRVTQLHSSFSTSIPPRVRSHWRTCSPRVPMTPTRWDDVFVAYLGLPLLK